jgi:GH24 family phage-related lysozyme (muramidase)
MAKRTPVSGLDISGISTKPVARPVDTYVRPAKIQTQPSPLSQFVDAIAPAVKAVEDKNLETRLKREREIENFRLKSKYAQMETNAYELNLSVENDFKVNEKTYVKDYTSTSYLEPIKKHQYNYLETLKNQGTDELVIEAAQLTFDKHNVKYVADFNAAKAKYNTDLLNNNNMDTHTQTMLSTGQTKEEKIKNHQNIITQFAEANPLPNGKPDFKRAIDNAYNLLKSQPTYDNTLWDALSTMKSKDGKKLPVMYTAEKRKDTAVMEKARDTQIQKNQLNKVKTETLAIKITDAINNGTRIDNITYRNPKTNFNVAFTTAEKDQYVTALIQRPEFQSKTSRAKLFAQIGHVPANITAELKKGIQYIDGTTVATSDDDNALIEQSYLIWESLKNANNNMTKLIGDDAHKLFLAMETNIREQATTGTYQPETMMTLDAEGSDPEVALTPRQPINYNNAANVISKIDIKNYKKSDSLKKLLATKVNRNNLLQRLFGGADLSEVTNAASILPDITERAHYIQMSDPSLSEEEVVEKAITSAEADYTIIKSGAGKNYAFKHLNTDVGSPLKPEVVLPEFNKVLLESKVVRQYVKQTFPNLNEDDLKSIDVAIEPLGKDPNQVSINLYNIAKGREFIGMFRVPYSKSKILSKKGQKVVLQEFANTLTKEIVPEGSTSYSTTTAPKTDFIEVGTFTKPSSEDYDTITTEMGTLKRSDLNTSVGSVIKYVLNSFGDPMVQNSEAIGALSTRLGKSLTDPIFNLIADEIKKAKDFEGFGADDVITEMGTIKSTDKDKQSSLLDDVVNTASNIVDQIKPISTASADSTLDNTKVSNQPTGDQVIIEGNTTEEKTANMIATQEGFSSTPYADGKDKSVGFGFYLPALEADEKALIKDVNNVTKEEGVAVLKLKVQKIGNYLEKEMQGFRNLPEEAQTAIISMGYQLGVTNLPKTWKKFTAAIKEAGQYEEGSTEQAEALAKAKFEMLYSKTKDGKTVLNKWAKQTKERAFEMANAVSDANLSV